ncbi:MAG TPA: glycoside hydrolase family protein [Rhodopila sp.]
MPTIGYGTTIWPNGRKVRMGDVMTQPQALMALVLDMEANRLPALAAAISVPLSYGMATALTSWLYNEGVHALSGSALAAMLNSGLVARAARQFNQWVRAAGKIDLGLMRRRELERRMFLGAQLNPTRAEVWTLGAAQLQPLCDAAQSDEARWRVAPNPAADPNTAVLAAITAASDGGAGAGIMAAAQGASS